MAQSVERSCTMLVHFDKPSSGNEIKEALEGNDGPAKVEALQKAIMMLLNGEQLPALFITIVRYVLPSEDHTVQKLLLLYLVSYIHGIWSWPAAMSDLHLFLCRCRKLLKRLTPLAKSYQKWSAPPLTPSHTASAC